MPGHGDPAGLPRACRTQQRGRGLRGTNPGGRRSVALELLRPRPYSGGVASTSPLQWWRGGDVRGWRLREEEARVGGVRGRLGAGVHAWGGRSSPTCQFISQDVREEELVTD
jgi:hypothetical protein